MKTKVYILSFIVFILGSSFENVEYFKKKVLVEGEIVTQGRFTPNGYLQFYLRQNDGQIESLTLRGTALLIPIRKTIYISEINKIDRTPISLKKSFDEMFTLEIDPSFNDNGGIIHSSITNNKGNTDYYRIEIVKEAKSFKIFRTKIDSLESFTKKEFDELNIELDEEKNIKDYEILPE